MENRRFNLWHNYMRNISAPERFITFAYYWMIGAALQRRVWLQDENKPLFPNQYIILVGKPGVGKGMAMTPVFEALKHHKKTSAPSPVLMKVPPAELTEQQKALLEAQREIQNQLRELAEKQAINTKTNRVPYLFPCAPDDITYQDLVHQMSLSNSRMIVDPPVPKIAPNGSYAHASIAVSLEEMATLFKRNSEQCLKMLLKVFDCHDYEYSTLSRGLDLIKRPCLSLLAGTTPGQIRIMLDHNIIDDGWSSRCVFVFGREKRFNTFGIRDFDESQRESFEEILKHLKDLSTIFGRLHYAPDTYEFLSDYFIHARGIVNLDAKLEPYYDRKNIHVPKLAAAIHFSEIEVLRKDGKVVYDNVLHLHEAKRAVELLEEIEVDMHLALTMKKENPLANVSDKILEALAKGEPLTRQSLVNICWDTLPNGLDSFDAAFGYLLSRKKIEGIEPIKGSIERRYRIT